MPPSLPQTITPLILPELPLKYRRKSGKNMSPIVNYREIPDFYSASSSPFSSSSFLHPFSPVSSPAQVPHIITKSSWDPLPSSSPSSPWQIDGHRSSKRQRLGSFDHHQTPFLLRGGSVEDEPTLISDVEPSEYSEDNDQSFLHDDEEVNSKHEELLGSGVKIVESPFLAIEGDVRSAEKVVPDTIKASAYHWAENTEVDIANTLLDFSRKARILTSEPYSHNRYNYSQRLIPLQHLPTVSFSDESQRQHSNDSAPALGPIKRTVFVEDKHHVSEQGTEGIRENISAKDCSPVAEYRSNHIQPISCSFRNVRFGKVEGSTAFVPIGNMPSLMPASETFHSMDPMNSTKQYAEIHPVPTRHIEIIDLHVTKHNQPNASQLLLSNANMHIDSVAPISTLAKSEDLTQSVVFRTSSPLNAVSRSQEETLIPDVIKFNHTSSSVLSEPMVLKSPHTLRKALPLSPNLRPQPSPSLLNQHTQYDEQNAVELSSNHVSERCGEDCRSQLSPRPASPLFTASSTADEPRPIFVESNTEQELNSSSHVTLDSNKSIKSVNTAEDGVIATKDIDNVNAENCSVTSMPHTEHELNSSLTQEVRGLLIQAMAVSRASSLPASSLQREIMRDAPHLSTALMDGGASSASSSRNKKLWLQRVNEILHSYPEFGRIDRKGHDAAGKPLEPHWFYIPDNDDDRERAALLVEMMPKKRNETKKYKQYYYRPLSKISRWHAEEDV